MSHQNLKCWATFHSIHYIYSYRSCTVATINHRRQNSATGLSQFHVADVLPMLEQMLAGSFPSQGCDRKNSRLQLLEIFQMAIFKTITFVDGNQHGSISLLIRELNR